MGDARRKKLGKSRSREWHCYHASGHPKLDEDVSEGHWKAGAGPTWHVGTVSIWIIAAEDRVGLVAVHDDVQGANGFCGRSTAEVLSVDGALVAPAVDVVLGMLRKNNGLTQTLAELSCLRGIAAIVDAEFIDGTSVPWLLSAAEWCLALEVLFSSWSS